MITHAHLAGLELARECVGNCNSETTAWDKCDELDKLIDEARAALSEPSHGEQVLGGWKLVPVDPTLEMLAAVTTSKHEALRAEVMRMAATDYRLMLAAAPSAVSQEQGE